MGWQPRAATGVYLVDELHMAGEALDGLLADAGLPQEHGEVIRARHQPLRRASTCRLIPLKCCLHSHTLCPGCWLLCACLSDAFVVVLI